MKKVSIVFGLLLLASLFTGCGSGFQPTQVQAPQIPSSDGLVVRGQALINVNFGRESAFARIMKDLIVSRAFAGSDAFVPVTVSVSNNTQFNINSTGFAVPASTVGDTLNFGSISISTLRDNDLSVCGSNGTTKCTQAVLRIYTQGVAGSGIWNSSAGYGAPLSATLGSTTSNVGLNVAGADVTHTFTIPANKNVVHLSDFSPTPSYSFKGDFSNAGAGSYSTTIVIEYGLQ